ncbi:hypothetical protein SteCoe_9451 [Stentor coeruleus]|uniref:Uncharacterized protein n=1 Tax=Stentor coeruleus TaxID=5963 RepID=A0A1R2CHV4_9CILI|nr:hypothetical protein SteCoe_9451 [Stentor coeruleus]
MFGPTDSYVGFPSRKDLMSMNNLNKEEVGMRKVDRQGDSRSLRTDDIEGAKPKSGLRRQADQNMYSGLNLPSYSRKESPGLGKPPRVPGGNDDYIASAAKFFGTTPPTSPRGVIGGDKPGLQKAGQGYIQNPEPTFNTKEAANFFGVTPPMSRAGNTYEQNPELSAKDLANFYGVTPPASRDQRAKNPYGREQGGYQPEDLPAKDYANFYGVTPPQSRPDPGNQNIGKSPLSFQAPNPIRDSSQRKPQGQSPYAYPEDVPVKAAANFYGATPPMSRQNLGPGVPSNINPAGLSDKDLANFYGVTPPPTGKPQGYQYIQSAPKDSYLGGLTDKDMANFYGVTPPPTGKPANPYAQNINNDPYSGGVSNKDLANFYGVTPPPTGKPTNPYGQNVPNNPYGSGVSNKDLANFYGVTPPPTGKPGMNIYQANPIGNFSGDPGLKIPQRVAQVLSPNPITQVGYPIKSPLRSAGQELTNKDYANFYGATPPVSSGKPYLFGSNQGQDLNAYPPGLSNKDLANFYGVTPPQSGKPPAVNNYNQVYERNEYQSGLNQKDYANFYGVTPPASGNVYASKGQEYPGNITEKDLANFYGVTPLQTRGIRN